MGGAYVAKSKLAEILKLAKQAYYCHDRILLLIEGV
jgi:hypothetical protein